MWVTSLRCYQHLGDFYNHLRYLKMMLSIIKSSIGS
nr:MAG TPA: hypothetical protein [Caudoviricetes sp.]